MQKNINQLVSFGGEKMNEFRSEGIKYIYISAIMLIRSKRVFFEYILMFELTDLLLDLW